MPTVLISGGTGLVGKRLTQLLTAKGYNVIILTRQTSLLGIRQSNISYAQWNIVNQTIDTTAIAQADYIIHLAGANVAEKRWTVKRKNEIIETRTQSSALLVKALKEVPNKVKAIVSASAIGWYGANTTESAQNGFKEDATHDHQFLGETCKLWEESIRSVEALGKRLVKLRIGIVLSKDGGVIKEFLKPLQLGVAAIIGNGKQVISWIHIDDVCRMFMYALENENLSGVYNAVAPKPATNQQLTIALAKRCTQFFIPVYIPKFILQWVLGEMSIEVLKSVTVSSQKIVASGFKFNYETIDEALQQLLAKNTLYKL